MEEVEGLPIETVYNLIKNGTLSLDDFKDWVHSDRAARYSCGYEDGLRDGFR